MKRLIFLLMPLLSWSQEEVQLSFLDFMNMVSNEHPIARQAELQTQLGEMSILSSKGAVDPKIFLNTGQKDFEGSDYYNKLNAGLKIPTWYAVSVEAGFEQNSGSFLNPENVTPDMGLYYLGLSLPVGRGLLIDERRAALRQAGVYSQLTIAEQQLMLNELLLNAGSAYWNWYKSYSNLEVLIDAYKVADERLNAVKQSANLGDRPQIDTLEAGIQRQTRKVQLKLSQLEFKNTQLRLQTYLWLEGTVPVELDTGTIPAVLEEKDWAVPFDHLDSLIMAHPELNKAKLKLSGLDIQRKLDAEMIKPELNLKYNVLSNDQFSDNSQMINNYTFGLQFSMPLFLRKERGKLRMTKTKMEQTSLEIDQKQVELDMKLSMVLNEMEMLKELITVQSQTVLDYSRLLDGERSLFEGGESSLFMVNSREMNYIQSQLKLIDLMSKSYLNQLKVRHALGILFRTT